MTTRFIPTGYVRHNRRSGLTDPWEPLFAAHSADTFSLGFYADSPHVNSRDFVHGGLLSALADNAMGLSCAKRIRDVAGLVTVSLNIDFLGTAHRGDWIEIRAKPTKIGTSLCFADAQIFANERLCATSKAVFKVSLQKPEERKA